MFSITLLLMLMWFWFTHRRGSCFLIMASSGINNNAFKKQHYLKTTTDFLTYNDLITKYNSKE